MECACVCRGDEAQDMAKDVVSPASAFWRGVHYKLIVPRLNTSLNDRTTKSSSLTPLRSSSLTGTTSSASIPSSYPSSRALDVLRRIEPLPVLLDG